VVAGAGEPGASRRQGLKRPGGPVRLWKRVSSSFYLRWFT